jgi:uncharacterized protein
MALKDEVAAAMKAAMKAGKKVEVEALRSLRAAMLDLEKKQVGYEITKDDEIALLSSASKKRKEAIEQFTKGNRPELAETERQELEVIQRYLPKQLDESEIESIVSEIMSTTGVHDMNGFGRVMGEVMKQVKGRADGGLVQSVVKRLLGSE